MAQIAIEHLSFSYPLRETPAVRDVTLNIGKGDFVLLCGSSGCGKTTLLRQIKKELAPHGTQTGNILFDGKPVSALSLRESAESIGFVMQDPDAQIVTDKVWHELAFGPENLGLSVNAIRLRVAEMASYFGINAWFDRATTSLSGGQKQMVNLASVMVMHPEILLLDEPTSQLDPIAAESFLAALGKINRELGTTIVLTEQRLEEAFAYADRVVVMENGGVVFDGTPQETGAALPRLPAFLHAAAPTAMRVFHQSTGTKPCPVTVRDGRRRLAETPHKTQIVSASAPLCEENAVELKNVSFRYTKTGADILKNLSLRIPAQSFFAVLGGNGAGKTTLLKVIAGLLTPYDGKIRLNGKPQKKSGARTAVLPQAVQTLFSANTVQKDLMRVNQSENAVQSIAALTGITHLLEKHPFDLSGGEQQRAALAKVLLCEPEILLLDEPTKGMDAAFKQTFAQILKRRQAEGCTVIMISHDLEFCAKYADRCAMLFDGEIAADADTHTFFNENRFYTTAANRMARGMIAGAVTDEDIKKCINKASFPA